MSTNCRVATKKQLLQEISLLVDQHINYILHKKPEYDFVIDESNVIKVTDEKEEKNIEMKNENNINKNEEEISVKDDNRCLAILTNGKRCSRDKLPKGKNDEELCKFHNNDKFIGRLEKVSDEIKKEPDIKINSEESINESAEEVEEVFLTKDEDDDLIDQDGNIWKIINEDGEEEEKIIGKKDLETNQKHFYTKI